jgi:hypothetical protein
MKDNNSNAKYSSTISNIGSNNNTNNIDMNLNNNNIDIDTDKQKFICDKCNKTFASSQTLRTHLLTTLNCIKEKNTPKKKCEYCDKEFSSKQMFIYHDNVCIQKKIFVLTNTYENKIKQLEEQLFYLTESSNQSLT